MTTNNNVEQEEMIAKEKGEKCIKIPDENEMRGSEDNFNIFYCSPDSPPRTPNGLLNKMSTTKNGRETPDVGASDDEESPLQDNYFVYDVGERNSGVINSSRQRFVSSSNEDGKVSKIALKNSLSV